MNEREISELYDMATMGMLAELDVIKLWYNHQIDEDTYKGLVSLCRDWEN
jgi:hypothetical protein